MSKKLYSLPRTRRSHPRDEQPPSRQIDSLRLRLAHLGICPDCGEIIAHDIHEPFAYCCWGTSEWTGTLPVLMELQFRIRSALASSLVVGDHWTRMLNGLLEVIQQAEAEQKRLVKLAL